MPHVVLAGERAVVDVAPGLGGRIAQLTIDDRPLLVGRDVDPRPMYWGSFPMVPWAGRVRSGRFTLDGTTHQLAPNMEPHAIHGVAFDRPWTVVAAGDTVVEMELALDWPFGGRAAQRLSLAGNTLTCELAVTADRRAMPVELGWHPWFVKPEQLGFAPEAMYVRDAAGLPTGELVPPRAGRWDDCFVAPGPARLRYCELEVVVASDCDHWVVYDEPLHATCVEPQSGPPDAFNIRPRVLRAGGEMRRTMRISWGGFSGNL